MKIKVLLFSLFRDICGSDELGFSFEGSEVLVSTFLESVYQKFPAMKEWDAKMLVAVNCEYSARNEVIKDGDEVALMPPVQGG
ncbi:MoaD/ThiS family protein [Verrucomicrobiales bacterium]|jgi:MoaE-MoaD fusion protein|nr:MoaD/ThiS family protein [Verrucomicrobiales bacterium]MDB4359136.1 MoaD/ThiS family protein [Verrucomicrobiales bacterium]